MNSIKATYTVFGKKTRDIFSLYSSLIAHRSRSPFSEHRVHAAIIVALSSGAENN